jgi:hypothetical protein
MSRNPKALDRALGQAATPAFKAWFRDSKVVDAQGMPLVLYHGTASDFSEFAEEKLGVNTGDDAGELGFFFTAKAWLSDDYAEIASKGGWSKKTKPGAPVVYPVYLSIKNPKRYETASSFYRDAEKFKSSLNEWRGDLERQGFDGVIVRGDCEEVIAFKPSQIKSVIGNRGTFDSASADIRYSRLEGGGEGEGGQGAMVTERKAPDWVPQYIWDLHEKSRRADAESTGEVDLRENSRGRVPSSGTLKRNQTMAFRRLNAAIEKYVGADWNQVNGLMVRMNEESSRRAGGRSVDVSADGAKEDQSTSPFDRWFGASKVVDDLGRPLLVYHATNQEFNAFDLRLDARRNGMAFFSDSRDAAVSIKENWGGQVTRVVDAYLSIEKPFDTTNRKIDRSVEDWIFRNNHRVEGDVRAYRSDFGLSMFQNYLIDGVFDISNYIDSIKSGDWQAVEATPSLIGELRRQGYDGIFFDENGGKTYAVFSSSQIKSATENTGAYDPENPDIRCSIAMKERMR